MLKSRSGTFTSPFATQSVSFNLGFEPQILFVKIGSLQFWYCKERSSTIHMEYTGDGYDGGGGQNKNYITITNTGFTFTQYENSCGGKSSTYYAYGY